jgi:hypothetical protein
MLYVLPSRSVPIGAMTGNVIVFLQLQEQRGIDRFHVAHKPEIGIRIIRIEVLFNAFRPGLRRQRLGQHQPAVLAAESDRLSAVSIQEVDDFHIDPAGQYHLHNFHRGRVGHSHPVPKLRDHSQSIQHLIDLRPPAMHDHGVEPDILQQHHILGKSLFQGRIGHRMPPVLDDDRLALEGADVGQGLDQHVRFLNQFVHALPPSSLPLTEYSGSSLDPSQYSASAPAHTRRPRRWSFRSSRTLRTTPVPATAP